MCMHFSFTSSFTPPFKTLNQDPQGPECKKKNSLQTAWISWSETCLIYSHGLMSVQLNECNWDVWASTITYKIETPFLCLHRIKASSPKNVENTPSNNSWFASTKSWHPLWVHPNARSLQNQNPQNLISQKITPLQISRGFDTLGCLILEGI